MVRKNRSLWREIWRHKEYEGPSLRDQIWELSDQDAATKNDIYLELVKNTENSSSGTRRKWKRALGLAT